MNQAQIQRFWAELGRCVRVSVDQDGSHVDARAVSGMYEDHSGDYGEYVIAEDGTFEFTTEGNLKAEARDIRETDEQHRKEQAWMREQG